MSVSSLAEITAKTNQLKGWEHLFPEKGGSAKERARVGVAISPHLDLARRERTVTRLALSLHVAKVLMFLRANGITEATSEMVVTLLSAVNRSKDWVKPHDTDEHMPRRLVGGIMGKDMFDLQRAPSVGFIVPSMDHMMLLYDRSIADMKKNGIEVTMGEEPDSEG